MNELLKQIETCIEFGKINNASAYPPNMKGQDGADELTQKALQVGISPGDVLNEALIPGMDKVGQKFSENKIFVPQMLMSAKAMNAAMQHIKPFFQSGAVKRKGTFIIGTVAGDLHDIGKNLVAMMIEGAGWEVIDLGVDIKSEQFIEAIKKVIPKCSRQSVMPENCATFPEKLSVVFFQFLRSGFFGECRNEEQNSGN
jgi:methanogenic corrinoid protein MtbC1